MSMKPTTFRDVTPCSLVNNNSVSNKHVALFSTEHDYFLKMEAKQYVPPICQYLSTDYYMATDSRSLLRSQQTAIAIKCSPQHHNVFLVFQVVSSFDVFQLKFCATTCPPQLTFTVFNTILPHYTLSGKQYALQTFSVFMFLQAPRSFLARPRLSPHSPFHL
jgi:hypothetical protein